MLRFLRGPPFEPLSSCSLRDLAQKVLFLVSLATARRVGELQAVSRDVSFSGSYVYLSYLPEFRRRRSLLLILFLALFVFALSRISLATFLMSFSSVLSALSVCIFLGFLPSLLVLALCLSLLALPLALSLRMLLASFFGTSSLRLTPFRLLRRLLLLPRLLPFVRTVFVGLLLLGLSLVTLLFLLFWRLPLGLSLRFLRPSTSGMFSSPLLMVLVWVL